MPDQKKLVNKRKRGVFDREAFLKRLNSIPLPMTDPETEKNPLNDPALKAMQRVFETTSFNEGDTPEKLLKLGEEYQKELLAKEGPTNKVHKKFGKKRVK